MPLHFTLLFPHGTYGWDPATLYTDGNHATTREFYAYLMNQRNPMRDYLHLAGRLYQEWICMGWLAVKNQNLTYQRLNQKAEGRFLQECERSYRGETARSGSP